VLTAIVLAAAGCREPRLRMPDVTIEQRNRISDLGRDIVQRNGVDELAAAMRELAYVAPPAAAVRALSEAVDGCVGDREVASGAAGRIATGLFQVVNGGYFGREEVRAVEQDLADALGCAAVRRDALHAAVWFAARGIPDAGSFY
jgi:hypothetical protein